MFRHAARRALQSAAAGGVRRGFASAESSAGGRLWSTGATGLLVALAGGGVVAGAAAASDASGHTFPASLNVAHADGAKQPAAEAPGSQDGVYTLYQYTVCPFCCKTKAVLDYYKVPYRTVEVNPLTKKELKWSDYKKVPVLVMDGEQYNDSSVIAEELQARFEGERKATWFSKLMDPQAEERERAEEAKWRKWVDEWFVRVITTNIYRSWGESVQTFDYITEHALNFGPVERASSRYVGAVGMYFIAKKMKKKYNIEGDDRTHLYAAVDEFIAAIGDKKFMGGEKPQLSDLYVFGVMRAVQGTETFKDVMANTSMQNWFVGMTEAVGSPATVA